jgi:hypothetical protein
MKTTAAVLVMLVMGSIPGWAALGGNEASVDTDVHALGGKHQVEARAGYSLHQITLQDGSTVKEFVSPSGTVFGVSWRSHVMPNLSQLLGNYLSDLQQGQPTQRIPRRGITIQGKDFYFTNFGRMMSFRGRAYVPSLIPANVSAAAVQ